METATDRAARLEKRRQAEEKFEEAKREKKAAVERMCRELVMEVFVEQVRFLSCLFACLSCYVENGVYVCVYAYAYACGQIEIANGKCAGNSGQNNLYVGLFLC
jgi:hypothetical protein